MKNNKLVDNFPALAAEWHPELNPDNLLAKISYGSKKEVWWLCPRGNHPWKSSVNVRTNASMKTKRDCPYCTGKKALLKGFNDLATQNPQVAKYWHPDKNEDLKPEDVSHLAVIAVWWRCDNGHEFQNTVNEMTKNSRVNFCAFCSGRKIMPHHNDLLALYPDIAIECVNSNDMHLSPGSHELTEWQCSYKHKSWWATPKDRVRGHGCPSCSGRNVIVGENDLATTHPVLIKDWHEDNIKLPQEVKKGSHYRAKWICSDKHVWETQVYQRALAKQGCPICASSTGEQEVHDFIVELLGSENVIHHDKSVLSKREIDIFIPSKNIGIEYNGLYWHSEKKISNKNYHYEKWKESNDNGIQLIQIWEDDWVLNKDLVKKMLAYKLGLNIQTNYHARKGKIEKISYQDAKIFLELHHIQGSATGSNYLGLYINDVLVSVLVLKNIKHNKSDQVEIVRYAASGNVRGGFSKMLRYAVDTYHIETLVTFSDNCISNGDLYKNNGFYLDKILPPDYMYVSNNRRKHKFGYRLKRFRNDNNLAWNENLTEKELAELNGLYRIWDSGKVRWVKEF